MRTFTTRHVTANQPEPFQLDDDPFVYQPVRLKFESYRALIKRAAELTDMAEALDQPVDTAAMLEQVERTVDITTGLLNTLLQPASRARLQERLDDPDDQLDIQDLVELLPQVLGLVADRPTLPPSDSSAGPSPTGADSTGSSSVADSTSTPSPSTGPATSSTPS
jgi:hypothetical protein